MPHSDIHWKQMIVTLQKSANHERAAAAEWKEVADRRLSYLTMFDKALSLILGRASKIVQVFDASAPSHPDIVLPAGASGEETARACRDKLLAMTHFTENLACSALEVERTLRDVYSLAVKATATARPTVDTSEVDLSQAMFESLRTTTEQYDATSPVTNGAFEDEDAELTWGAQREPVLRRTDPEENEAGEQEGHVPKTPLPSVEAPVDFMALMKRK